MKKNVRLSRWKKALIISLSALLGIIFVVMPTATVVIYESIFSFRFETEEWLRYSVEDFDGLLCERSDFYSTDGTRLAGYKYSKDAENVKGVVVVAHGLGGGGHNFYMPFIDVFASNGYKVFASGKYLQWGIYQPAILEPVDSSTLIGLIPGSPSMRSKK